MYVSVCVRVSADARKTMFVFARVCVSVCLSVPLCAYVHRDRSVGKSHLYR